MKRRNILIGMGGIAGAGAAIGTGAFDQVNADRAVSVNVEGDADAYLGLEPINSAYATTDGDGVLELTFDEDGGAGGDGFNPNSTTRIDGVFSISNQGTQDVGVSVEKGGLAEGVDKFDFLAQTDTDEESLVYESPVVLESGESFDVGVEAEISSSDTIDGVIDDDEIVITADVDDEGGADELQPVQNVDQGESYDSIGAAVGDAGEGDTIQVASGTYPESVTIGVDGLTLEAADGANPTVTQEAEEQIPVLVDDADDVTVDDENIEFLSGIDVGADIGEYPDQDPEDFDFAVKGDEEPEDFDGEDTFETIDAATDEAGEDDRILVYPGEYDFEGALDDDDRAPGMEIISLEGPDDTEITGIDTGGGDAGERGISLREPRMVLQGFTITNEATNDDAPSDAIISIRGNEIEVRHNVVEDEVADGELNLIRSSGLEDGETGVVIENNKFRSTGKFGIQFTGETGASDQFTISNNEIVADQLDGAAAIGIADSDGSAITGNTIRDGGSETAISLTEFPETVTNIEITGNLIENNGIGVFVFGQDSDSQNSITTLENNHIVDSEPAIMTFEEASLTVPADKNWFGTADRGGIEVIEDGSDEDAIEIDPFAGAPIDPDAGSD